MDFVNASVAMVLGTRVARSLAGHERDVQLVGALALLVVVAVGVREQLRAARAPVHHPAPALPAHHVLARFVALTAINPMTAVYFIALTTGLADRLTQLGPASPS